LLRHVYLAYFVGVESLGGLTGFRHRRLWKITVLLHSCGQLWCRCWFQQVKLWGSCFGKIELYGEAEGKRDVRRIDVPAAQADGDGSVEVAESVKDGALQIVVLFDGDGLEHVSEDDAAHAF